MTVPTLTGQSLFDGSAMTIAPTGKPMAVVYLAHWCPHCQAEVPRIVELAEGGQARRHRRLRGGCRRTTTTLPNYPPSVVAGGRGLAVPDDGRQRELDGRRRVRADRLSLLPARRRAGEGRRPGRGRGSTTPTSSPRSRRSMAGKPVDLGARRQLLQIGATSVSRTSLHTPTRSTRWRWVRKPVAARDRGGRRGDRALEPGRRGHVLHPPARRADEVVVVPGEVLGQLPARELVGAHDPVHDPGLLEHHEIAVHRALREAAPGLEDLGDGQRAWRLGERARPAPPGSR